MCFAVRWFKYMIPRHRVLIFRNSFVMQKTGNLIRQLWLPDFDGLTRGLGLVKEYFILLKSRFYSVSSFRISTHWCLEGKLDFAAIPVSSVPVNLRKNELNHANCHLRTKAIFSLAKWKNTPYHQNEKRGACKQSKTPRNTEKIAKSCKRKEEEH